MVESFGFWRRKSRVKDVEVITAEYAGFSEEKDESLQTLLVYTSGASHWGVASCRSALEIRRKFKGLPRVEIKEDGP